MLYQKPSLIHYRFAQVVCGLVSKLIFRNKILRNEIKGKKGPFVVIANHQCALDFVNLIGACARPMSFVISRSFFRTLPIQGYLRKMGVIPKQQFQTTVKDMKQMKAVIDQGAPLVIYPAGLMCEDGLSTPIPAATYKFLKWLGVDVYVARSYGSYFVMPKWNGGFRPGRTHIDIYKLFSAGELKSLPLDTMKNKTDEALLFDAYREQETFLCKYQSNHVLEGLEHVLYQCPNCGEEYSISVRDQSTLFCESCGYTVRGDTFGFLHRESAQGPELRYVSDWSRLIFQKLKERILENPGHNLSLKTRIRTINGKKNKFEDAGEGTLCLSGEGFLLEGTLKGEQFRLELPVGNLPTLPFSPGKHLELQHGNEIYRCLPEDGRLVMKLINLVKIYYQLQSCAPEAESAK